MFLPSTAAAASQKTDCIKGWEENLTFSKGAFSRYKKNSEELLQLKKDLKYFSNITDNASILMISAINKENIKKLLYAISNISYSI